MEFLKLLIDAAIPPGYSLTTVTKAAAQLPKILLKISFEPGERVRLKNGCLYAGKVVRRYRVDTRFKLVGLSASSKSNDVEEELTEEDVLIALAYAGDHDDVEEVKELVSSKGAHILSQEVASANFCTVVHICASSGSIRTLATLFEQYSESIRPEAVDGDGDNALHDLAPCPKNGQEAARIILRRPHATNMLQLLNQLGRTPLHDAILCSNESVCKGLLDTQTATPEIDWLEVALKTSHEDTALHLAVKKGYIDVVDGILAYPGAKDRNLANKVNRRGETPLHLASSLGHEEICSKLLKYGASIQMKDRAGRFPVTNAFRRRHTDVVQTLLEFCLDKTTLINEKFEFGLTLLHVAAATSSDTHVFSSLLKAGAFGDARSDDGKTPLHVATERPNWIAFRYLLRSDIKFSDKMSHEQWVNMQDFSGQTALHNAVRCKRHVDEIDILSDAEAVATLCNKGALVDLKNRHGETPLHIAAREGQPEVVEYLLSNYEHCSHSQGTDRDTWMIMCDFSGETALHEATRSSRKDIVERLLRETQNLNYLLQVRDIETRTALHWAVQKNNEEIVEAMLTRADQKTKLFLLWNVIGTAAQVPEVLKKHVEQATGDVQTNLLQIAADVQDLDMARELINRGAEITTLQKNSHLWLSKNLCRKASDRPALEDSLGRRRLVHGTAALLLNPYTGTPITIGVFGEWGTGKSSFMLQVEATLLQMAVKEIFKKTLPSDKSDRELLGRIIHETKFSSTGEKLRSQVDKALRKCMSQTEFEINEGDDFIDNFPIKSQSECRHLFKELALTDRSNLVQSSDGQVRHNAMATDQSLEEALATGHIPAVLTVRYNAWQYENKVEASAGLAVEITQEIEGCMTPPQWLRMCCKYSWKEQPKDIFVQLLLPIFLAFIAASIVLVLWKVAPIKIEYKLLSLPVGVLGVIWVFFRTLLRVVQPVTHAIQKYIRSPDHKSMLGYQQRVIDDIGFLKEQLCVEADQVWWRIFGFLGWFFISNSYNVKDTHVRKQHPQLNNLRIVVFIDDLDRCQEKTILEVYTHPLMQKHSDT